MSIVRHCALAGATLALLAAPALAHDHAPAAATFQSDLAADMGGAGKKLIALAEAIPADKYGWAPAEGVRSMSEVFMHVVGANMMLPAAIGVAPPSGLPEGNPMEIMGRWEKEVTAKEEVIQKLKDSFAYAEGAVTGIPDAALTETVQLFGPEPIAKRRVMLILQSHAHEHLGQAIAYARSLGVTPPWSRPAEGGGEMHGDGEPAQGH